MLNTIFIILIGIVLGGVGSIGYFTYTGSTLNWKRKR